VKDAFRIQLNKFTTDEIVSMRDSLEKAVEKQITIVLNKEGFQLEQLTSGLKYPESIVEAVNAKNRSVQEAQKASNEVLVAEAEARKLIVKAKAQKEANDLLQQSLTPLLIRKMAIEKWDGHLSKYSGQGMQFIMGE
jgi:regulator of protease activity HflC (stomatin/prohibitin superfamily)